MARVDAGGLDAAALAHPIIDADKTIASLRPRFRRCYQAGLDIDPRMQGCVLVDATVTPDGNVERSAIATADGLSSEVALCIADTIHKAKFSAPGGGGTKLYIPVTFVQLDQ